MTKTTYFTLLDFEQPFKSSVYRIYEWQEEFNPAYEIEFDFQIFSDGSFMSKSRKGVSTCLILKGDTVVGKVWQPGTFKNCMMSELNAVILGLEEIPVGARVKINTDSKAVVYLFRKILTSKCYYSQNKKYQSKPVINLLSKLETLLIDRIVTASWVSRKHPLIKWCHNCCQKIDVHWGLVPIDERIILKTSV